MKEVQCALQTSRTPLVDQVLQQLQEVGLTASQLGARSLQGSPGSSPGSRGALQPSRAANQGGPLAFWGMQAEQVEPCESTRLSRFKPVSRLVRVLCRLTP